MIKKKILVSRIKCVLGLSREYKKEILEMENKREVLGLYRTPHMSFVIRYINEIMGILEGKR